MVQKHFSKNQKKECFEYADKNGLNVFQKDLNETGAKILVVDSYENIFEDIKNNIALKKNNYYEYWDANKPIKLFIDYDKKINEDNAEDDDNVHKTDIVNLINTIKKMIPRIKDTYILKSIPNITKKSYHIIFDGIYFLNRLTLKKFMEDQLKPKFKELFDKHIIDIKVYGDICFRTLLSSKSGENRALFMLKTDNFINELSEIPLSIEETTLDHFLKTCISNISSCEVYNYKPEKKKTINKKLHLNEGDIFSDKEIIRKYLDLLDADRYSDYNKWINIGFILFSIHNEYDDLWHYFSAKSDKYDKRICTEKWNTFASSEYKYTINNLIYLAKIDNPDDSIELEKEIPDHDIKFLRPLDNILSKYIYRLYSDKFVCCDPHKDEWYYFNGIRWLKENKSHNLRKLIITEVFNYVENYKRLLIKDGCSDDIIKNYQSIIMKLSTGIKLNCLDIEFYNKNFYEIMDQNKDLIGFENGVFDLVKMEFRYGINSDYITLSTKYNYTHFKPTDPLYIEVIELIRKIIPNKDTRHYTLKSLASCLDGYNRDENFYIWAGKNSSGGNGKSTLTELLSKTLGDYAIFSPVTLLTGKRESANSANSALAAIRNKRVVILQEPGANDVIQAEVMKSLTGGDKISTRDLNSIQCEFKPHAKFIMCSNAQPKCSSMDGGVIRRLKLIEFESKFVTNPKNTDENEFQIDRDLKNKLDLYKEVFMSILIDYYKIYREEELIPPETVLHATKKYEDNNNIIKTFVEENKIVKGEKSDFVDLNTIKMLYQADRELKNHFSKQSDFILFLENYLCTEFKSCKKESSKRLYGYYIKQDYEDEDEENL